MMQWTPVKYQAYHMTYDDKVQRHYTNTRPNFIPFRPQTSKHMKWPCQTYKYMHFILYFIHMQSIKTRYRRWR